MIRPTVARIDLNALKSNYQRIVEHAAGEPRDRSAHQRIGTARAPIAHLRLGGFVEPGGGVDTAKHAGAPGRT